MDKKNADMNSYRITYNLKKTYSGFSFSKRKVTTPFQQKFILYKSYQINAVTHFPSLCIFFISPHIFLSLNTSPSLVNCLPYWKGVKKYQLPLANICYFIYN